MNRGGTIFGDRGGVAGAMGGGGGMQGGYNPYGIQRGSGVFKVLIIRQLTTSFLDV